MRKLLIFLVKYVYILCHVRGAIDVVIVMYHRIGVICAFLTAGNAILVFRARFSSFSGGVSKETFLEILSALVNSCW